MKAPTLLCLLLVGPLAAAPVDFAGEVQPILAKHCHQCHGAEKNKADLRLDVREAALKGGESGAVLAPGRAAESLLLKRVVSADPDEVMPPKGERLTAAEVDTLRHWIDEGAAWPDEHAGSVADASRHWAFTAPQRPPLPAASAEGAHPIDTFVEARLRREGLAHSPPAAKGTLLRRLHLDLTGLPPSLHETAAFEADTAPDATARKIDELLASPHFGERWGRHWLDAARYADSQGFEKDPPRHSVWFWRDWVIRAVNGDMPYDRFLLEQLAGDLLPGATQDQVVATGFLRQSMVNEEGGVDPEQFRMDAMFDRMDCLGKAVLGLTIQCAQCHNHKYDPITQEDYYRMFAFLNNDHEPQRVVHSPSELQTIGTLRSQMRELDAGLRETLPDWATRLAAWEKDVASASGVSWTPVTGEFDPDSIGGQKYVPQPDASWLAQGYAPTKHNALLNTTVPVTRVSAFRLELLTDPNLPCNGPGRSFKGTCALSEFAVKIDRGKGLEPVKLASADADFGDAPDSPLEPNFEDKSGRRRVTGPAAFAIDGNQDTAWGIDAGPGRRNQPRVIVFRLAEPVEVPAGTAMQVTLGQNHGGWNSDDLMTNNLGRFRLSVTGAGHVPAPVASPRVLEAMSVPEPDRSEAQREVVFAAWRATEPAAAEVHGKVEALWKAWPQGATALVLQRREEPRTTSILKRGDWLSPGRQVTAGVPAVLHRLPADAPPTWLGFAQWITARESPTTARTFVNRTWQQLFGTGLVASAEDLGVQSEPPSHPALLDWLAVDFMDRGWSVKQLLRTILTSRTYQQASHVSAEAAARDPQNRLLARGPRFRVEAEIVRDIALATSGLLDRRIGGPSVMTPAPLFLFQPPASYAPFPWVNATGPDRYRRALYTFRRRSTPYPVLQTFDAPNGDQACVRRSRSNTPLQALTALNEELFVDCARALGRRMVKEGGFTTEERVTWAFREVLGRPPEAAEVNELVILAVRQRKRLAEGTIHPEALLADPAAAGDRDLAVATVIARVLLNLDETITKE